MVRRNKRETCPKPLRGATQPIGNRRGRSLASLFVLTADLATSLTSWIDRAACRSMPATMFYPPLNESHTARDERVRIAKLVCANCPVCEDCRDYALRAGERLGVWGGTTETERRELIDGATS
jgi:WhiB family redox-sensing transcriptional regulator